MRSPWDAELGLDVTCLRREGSGLSRIVCFYPAKDELNCRLRKNDPSWPTSGPHSLHVHTPHSLHASTAGSSVRRDASEVGVTERRRRCCPRPSPLGLAEERLADQAYRRALRRRLDRGAQAGAAGADDGDVMLVGSPSWWPSDDSPTVVDNTTAVFCDGLALPAYEGHRCTDLILHHSDRIIRSMSSSSALKGSVH